ncbi:MAG: hypothetical protein KGV59_05435 [Tenacibaculum sp.]|nr:hypothetical protein [Tenacibaculum sp.]
MAGLKALFNMSQVENVLQHFQEEVDNKVIEIFQYMGEEFVNKARDLRTYVDDTGNLRSSIGYIILNNGKVVDANFKKIGDDGDTGVSIGYQVAEEVARDYPKGYALIGVAGMHYACALERRHHIDVISGSAPTEQEIRELLESIANEK